MLPGIFGNNDNEKRIAQLERAVSALENKSRKLEADIDKKVTDFEQEAKDASERAVTYKNEIEANASSIQESLTEVNEKLNELRESHSLFLANKNTFDEQFKDSEEKTHSLSTLYVTATEDIQELEQKISELQKILDNRSILDDKIERIDEVYTRSNDLDAKIAQLNRGITDRKKEIDDLYYDIIGTTIEDVDTGDKTDVPGKKAELEDAYVKLKADIEEQNKELESLSSNTKENYRAFVDTKEEEYNGYVKRIADLLPNAMTAGLSAAYQQKKSTEETEYTNLTKTFNRAILGLIAVSLLPISVSIYSLLKDVEVQDVLIRVPRLVVAILPLYIPVLWVAYSANKKRNLSKRLIEEYSHKETLSRTFEGLSREINNIEDKSTSADLRVNLLYNILQVNSENPGKLISDYDKSDHPLMDALDKSIKLTNAVTRLAKLPGFSRLANSLGEKAEQILKNQEEKASAGLEIISKKNNE